MKKSYNIICSDKYEKEKLTSLFSIQKDDSVFEMDVENLIENEIIIHFACVGGKTCESIVRSAKIEERFIAVIEKNPVGEIVMDSNIKRNRAIQGIGIWGVGKIVGVIIFIPMTSSI